MNPVLGGDCLPQRPKATVQCGGCVEFTCWGVNHEPREVRVSEKSYTGKIHAHMGRPVLTYINTPAGRSTVLADQTSEE